MMMRQYSALFLSEAAVPCEVAVSMLLTVFLPFNLLKGGLNMIITLLCIRPLWAVVSALKFYDDEAI